MNLQRIARIRVYLVEVGRNARGQFMRLPATAQVMFGLSLLAVLLMTLGTAYWGKDATLRIRVQHSLRSAQFSLWVDGDLAYSGNLAGTGKRRFGLIPSVQGTLSETLAITPGTHQIKVQIGSDSGMQENTISGAFAHKQQRTLSVNASRADIALSWQAMETVGTESSPRDKGWISRYAGTLMMTVAGSIISALTGFALKELPKQIASRQREAPRA
jgi:hypothetical protein